MSANRTARAVLVDDERLARQKLRTMLLAHPEVEVVGEADSVRRAVEVIEADKPDVVFLDIQLPGESGFDLLHRAAANFKVIFVTAFDEHAIRAFEVNALDYLLKPVTPARLAASVERLFAAAPAPDKPPRALERDDHLFLHMESRSGFVKVADITCIRAAGPYSEVYTADGKKALVLKSMKEWEERLPEKVFARIHRSTIVNLECVERVEKWFNYSYQVRLRNLKEPLTMSRRYAARLKDRMR